MRIRFASGSAILFQATFSRQDGATDVSGDAGGVRGRSLCRPRTCVPEVLEESSVEYEAKLLDFLISNLLLGQAKSFPYPKRTHRMPQDAIEGGVARHALPNSIRSHGQRAPCERSEWSSARQL